MTKKNSKEKKQVKSPIIYRVSAGVWKFNMLTADDKMIEADYNPGLDRT